LPVVHIDDTLRNTIKDERKKRGIRGDVLAKDINKSASYISQIENGTISTMDISILYAIFKRIIDLPEKDLSDYLIKTFNKNIKFTKDDIHKKEWLLNLEYQFRLFPITPEIINFLETKLKELDITPKDLVLKINKNEDLDDDLLDKLKDNVVWVKMNENGQIQTAIKFALNEDYIDNILEKKIRTINKINMDGILYNIYKLEGMNPFDANIKADKNLLDFKFYTLEERNIRIKEAKTENKDLSTMILKEDTECNNYINKIIKHFIALRDINPVYGIDVFSVFYKSLSLNKKLMYSLLKLDFSKLKDISDERKKNFIDDIEQLLSKYSKPTEDDFIL
jgi:transcriptional regulator with XRE-family HTH domain